MFPTKLLFSVFAFLMLVKKYHTFLLLSSMSVSLALFPPLIRNNMLHIRFRVGKLCPEKLRIIGNITVRRNPHQRLLMVILRKAVTNRRKILRHFHEKEKSYYNIRGNVFYTNTFNFNTNKNYKIY